MRRTRRRFTGRSGRLLASLLALAGIAGTVVIAATPAAAATGTAPATANAKPAAATNTATDQTPDGAVRAFNAALSERRINDALALLVPGAVNFQLEPAHAFAAPQPGSTAMPLTSDLATHWRTVAPVLYSTNQVYRRQVDEATVHADGRLAMVWARVRTRAEPLRGTPSLLVFSETYLLRLDDGHWRIAGVAQSRGTR